jgi:hypothetical protein
MKNIKGVTGMFMRLRSHLRHTSTYVAGAQEDKSVMRVSWLPWFWPAIIVLSATAVGLVTFVFPGTAVRPALVMWFLFVCPGMTVVRFLRLAEAVIEWMLALALSFAIDACVACILLYAGWWSPERVLSILIGFCLVGVMVQLAAMYSKLLRLS